MARAADYLSHAREVNAVARTTLALDGRDATPLAAKISIGLSLQAAELAGKAMLRVLGHSVDDIRRQHRKHNLLALLRQVQAELQQRPEEALRSHSHFLLWAPTIDGNQFGSTIAAYFEMHFARGPSASPRSYFYPDEQTFAAPVPIHAIYVMVEHIIEAAEAVIEAIDV